MKYILSLTTSLLLAALCCVSVAAPAPRPDRKVLEAQLAKAKTPGDSVRILYNIFDSSSRQQQATVGRLLLETAGHAHDYSAQNDMLRQLSVLYMKFDTIVEEFEQKAAKMPRSLDSRITKIFIAQQRLFSRVAKMTEEERASEVAKTVAEYQDTRLHDPLHQLNRLFSVATILGQATQGGMYLEAIERMAPIIDSLPQEAYPLKNQYLTLKANVYTNNDQAKLALQADRELLAIIDKMERAYHAHGRIYRNYEANRFLCYRRMLSNYRGLTPAEVEDFYAKILSLTAANEELASNEKKLPRSEASYRMARKEYAQAIPLLQKCLADPKLPLNLRRQLLIEMRLAARATGDDALLLRTLEEYTEIIDKFDSLRTADQMSELAIRCQVGELRQDRAEKKAQELKRQNENEHRMRVFLVVVILLLVVALIILMPRVLRTRRKKTSASESPENPPATQSPDEQ